MERRLKPDSIPVDLIVDILLRLPTKSINRFRCVSKLWDSIIHRPYFTKLFYTLSQAPPRLILAIEPAGKGVWQVYSTPQPQNPCGKTVVAADFNMKFHTDDSTGEGSSCDDICDSMCYSPGEGSSCSYASGLMCFSKLVISKMFDYDYKFVICNPTTRQYANLPKLSRYGRVHHFLGFDPIDKQFKVLSMAKGYNNKILTLGNGSMTWRKIPCPLSHHPCSMEGICINGVLYYYARVPDGEYTRIVCFDVRSEKFKCIPSVGFFSFRSTKLINYKGKLGVIRWTRTYAGAIVLRMRVLEDVEKHEWSEYVYTLPDITIVDPCDVFVVGVTSTGEIVLSIDDAYGKFYVFYFNPEKDTLQTVEISGIPQFDNRKRDRVHIYLDHVEYLKFNMMNATSTSLAEHKCKPMSSSTSSKQHHANLTADKRSGIEYAWARECGQLGHKDARCMQQPLLTPVGNTTIVLDKGRLSPCTVANVITHDLPVSDKTSNVSVPTEVEATEQVTTLEADAAPLEDQNTIVEDIPSFGDSEVVEDPHYYSDCEYDMVDHMTPSGQRVVRERSRKISIKAKRMQSSSKNSRRGNGGRHG